MLFGYERVICIEIFCDSLFCIGRVRIAIGSGLHEESEIDFCCHFLPLSENVQFCVIVGRIRKHKNSSEAEIKIYVHVKEAITCLVRA